MTTERPAGARREETPDGRSAQAGVLLARLEFRERLAAIVDELGRLDPDLVDVPATLAEGLLEDLDLLLADERPT